MDKITLNDILEPLSVCCKADMYSSGACTHCGADGRPKKANMAAYMDRFRVGGNPNQDHFIADQVFQYFKKKIAFPRIMKMVKEHGRDAIYKIWNDVRQSKPRNEVALFLWKVKENKIDWQ